MKNIRIFYLKIFIFLVVKFSVYLNRYVFVMTTTMLIMKDELILCLLSFSLEDCMEVTQRESDEFL